MSDPTDVINCIPVLREALQNLLCPYGLEISFVADSETIPGSFFGEREAGLVGHKLYLRDDTPLHSALHEAGHFICMDPARREALHTNAEGDYDEENAVCYLQILLSDFLPGIGREKMMWDMDRWGYTFRLGSAANWFYHDADDARQWLEQFQIIDLDAKPTGQRREQHAPNFSVEPNPTMESV